MLFLWRLSGKTPFQTWKLPFYRLKLFNPFPDSLLKYIPVPDRLWKYDPISPNVVPPLYRECPRWGYYFRFCNFVRGMLGFKKGIIYCSSCILISVLLRTEDARQIRKVTKTMWAKTPLPQEPENVRSNHLRLDTSPISEPNPLPKYQTNIRHNPPPPDFKIICDMDTAPRRIRQLCDPEFSILGVRN